MSLNIAISSAVSSLLAIEKQLAVASANVSNATVNGYTAKSVTLETQVTNGGGSGVDVAAITSSVNKYLLKDILSATTAAGADSTTSDYYTSLQNLLGEVSDSTSGSDLSSQLTKLSTALQNLEATPDDVSLKNQVVNDLDDLAANLRSTSNGIQDLRTQADQEIGDKVTEVNSALDNINDLNKQIALAKSRGESTADLEDQRNTALQTIAGDMNVSSYTDSNDQLHIFTAGNQALLNGTVVNHLSHSAASSISDGVVYSGSSGTGISGIYVAGTDITSQITGGNIGALIDMRDNTLVKAQDELDNLASGLSSAVNAVTNQGSASPPPSSLTGTTTVAATDAISPASGTTLRVALTDSSGKITSYQDVDLSSATSVQDVLDSLNAISGVTASITDGHLAISNSSGGGVAISTLSGTVGGTDVSSYFGLNDVVTGGSSAQTFSVRSDLLSNSSLLSTGKLSQSATLTVGDTAIGASDASIVTSLYNTLTSSNNFAAAGWLGSTSTSFSSYAANLISDIATRSSNATSDATASAASLNTLTTSFSNQSGVNTDEQTALLSQLQSYYAASAQVISTANAMFTSLINAVAS
ncbi:MAG TPA: flagellar hook-associated protein FlgK [Dongiaceae bacterium]|nr:flagellar hook-associated protein FlgK [Dongiaceae bacterium]